jgi:predicted transcriptional regulator
MEEKMAYIPASVMIRAILQAGHTQDWLARVVGVSPTYINKILTNDMAERGLAVEKYFAIKAVWELVISKGDDNGHS